MKNLFKCSVFLFLVISCNTPKYTYYFDTGKYLDFSQGKWLLNKSKSNSTIFDKELYQRSKEEFEVILGDSLVEINDLRVDKLIPSKIDFEITKQELNELYSLTECTYLINIKGNIITEGLGSIAVSNSDLSTSNQASVFIWIYNLKVGELISSSQVYAEVNSQDSQFDNNSKWKLSTSSHTGMVNGVKKLIGRYNKYKAK
ncbi:hypothetical protein [Maribacter sp. R86514]|uniref:hypothetical protein n=1 Tax=Maribacter sp. R86514 TaxID=3093854 RepID=UPI0037CCBF64